MHFTTEGGALRAMELDDVEAESQDLTLDLLDCGIHEDTNTSCSLGQVARRLTYVACAALPTDESHPVHAQGFDRTYIVGIAHSANLQEALS